MLIILGPFERGLITDEDYYLSGDLLEGGDLFFLVKLYDNFVPAQSNFF